ncbi:MAG: hypothetical protein ACMXYF_04060 [Candidatus Woesearchaeota archaeon]
MKLSKKGTEKPIEIFVALFIILAVAMLLLNMFRDQISDRTTQLSEYEAQARLAEELSDARSSCQNLCTQAVAGRCTELSQARFCMQKIQGGLDLNGDSIIGGVDEQLLAGVAICEDGIYCPMLIECNCGKQLTMQNCREVLCSYWYSQGMDSDAANARLESTYNEGTCNLGDHENSWISLYFEEGLSCFFNGDGGD